MSHRFHRQCVEIGEQHADEEKRRHLPDNRHPERWQTAVTQGYRQKGKGQADHDRQRNQ